MMLAGAGDRVTKIISGTTLAGTAPPPDRVKVDPDVFGARGQEVPAGLYVWVREGRVSVAAGGESADATAGEAVVATDSAVRQLDAVPSFMRFDKTPLPIDGTVSPTPGWSAAAAGQYGFCRVR